jgi:putative endonuclease
MDRKTLLYRHSRRTGGARLYSRWIEENIRATLTGYASSRTAEEKVPWRTSRISTPMQIPDAPVLDISGTSCPRDGGRKLKNYDHRVHPFHVLIFPAVDLPLTTAENLHSTHVVGCFLFPPSSWPRLREPGPRPLYLLFISHLLESLAMEIYVYILASQRNGTLYIGVTSDLKKRMYEHKNHIFKGFTSEYGVHILAYYERFESITRAIDREKDLKRWRRAWKIELIEKENLFWKDLSENI